nr:hypothetical protein [Mitsuokella multacida]
MKAWRKYHGGFRGRDKLLFEKIYKWLFSSCEEQNCDKPSGKAKRRVKNRAEVQDGGTVNG